MTSDYYRKLAAERVRAPEKAAQQFAGDRATGSTPAPTPVLSTIPGGWRTLNDLEAALASPELARDYAAQLQDAKRAEAIASELLQHDGAARAEFVGHDRRDPGAPARRLAAFLRRRCHETLDGDRRRQIEEQRQLAAHR